MGCQRVAIDRACNQGQLKAAAPLIRALKDVGLRPEDRVIRDALAGVTGEQWPS